MEVWCHVGEELGGEKECYWIVIIYSYRLINTKGVISQFHNHGGDQILIYSGYI